MARNKRPAGRGIYIWQIDWAIKEFGSPEAVAQHIIGNGFKWVIWKVLEGKRDYQTIAHTAHTSEILRQAGVQVWGYQYVYPGGLVFAWQGSPIDQAKAGVDMVGRLGLDGFVIDAESQMKNKPVEARTYASNLRAGLPDTPIALSSYRYPIKYHPDFPWESFLPFIDLNMPQVYWQGSHNPGYQLEQTKKEYDQLAPGMDLIPIGSAYSEHGWTAAPDDLVEFHEKVIELGYSAEGYWEYRAAFNLGLMADLKALPNDFPGMQPPTPTPVPAPPDDWEDYQKWVETQIEELAGDIARIAKFDERLLSLVEAMRGDLDVVSNVTAELDAFLKSWGDGHS